MGFDVDGFLGGMGLSMDYFIGRGLRCFDDAESLAVVQVDEDGREHELVPEACEAWERMRGAAAEDGVEIFVVSAFRSVARQGEIVRGKMEKGIGAEEIFAVSAPPGFSEHHTGLAVDVSTPGYAVLEEEFEESAAFAWMRERAGEFGFFMTYPRDNAFGYIYEPWHWCFDGGGRLA